MKERASSLTILLFALLLTGPCCKEELRAQTRLVRHYTINEGLSNNAVYSITQDCKGRIWLGTIDGLHSFDGNEIRVWRDETVFSLGSSIYTLAEDNRHRLWIGSERGIALFDLTQERFSELNLRTSTGELIQETVSDVIRDRQDRMWVATMGQGLFCYDPRTEKLTQYTSGRTDSEFIAHIMEDADGTLWITSTETGISRYQNNKDNFIHVAGTPEDGIISLCQDSEGNIWAGSSRHGLYLLDRDNKKLIPRLTPKNRRSILQIRSIVERMPGQLLLASDEGLTQYGTHSGEWRTLKAQPGNADRLNDNYLQTLYFDREGALWVGTYFGGANYFSPEGDNFRHYHRSTCDMDARIISVMAQADGDNLWIGTDDAGFFYWNRRENSFRPYRPANGQPDGYTPSYHNIHALLQTEDKLFVGMYMGGLDIMDLKSGHFRNYMPSPSSLRSLYSSGVYALCRDCQGEVWIGTTGGLNRYVPETDDFERVYEVHPADVSCIVDDPTDSLLWVCSLNQGVFCLDRRQHQWQQYTAGDNHHHRGEEERIKPIPTDRVVTACIDTQHRLWVGTDGHGLLQLDRENSRFVQVETGCDIRVVYKIMQQGDGLWLTTSDGLFCYHPESGITHRYNRQDGLQDNQFQPNSGIALADGTLLVGGINGFNEFRPSQMVHTDTIRPTVILSDFQLSNRPVRVGDEGSPLKNSITYTESLTLQHRHSIFSLQVATPSYINPTRNRYRYKLEGFEKQWTESDVAPRVTYTNLPPGRYTFRVNASTSNGIWHSDVISLPIRVLPPWWLSTPSLLIYALLVAAALAIAYLRFMSRQREKMEALRTEKDKELYESKIEFFTLMIHEIRTPLTLILAPIENVMRQGGTVSSVMPQLQMVERNGKRLFNLVNQLMDFRKTESGKMEVTLHCVELKSLLAGICQNFTLSAELKQIKIEATWPEGPCYATTDEEALTKMVVNLLSNALKFTTSHIWINLGWEGEKPELRIRDNGPGIGAEQQAKVFLPFYQVKENRPDDNIGTGIGLSLVKKLADLTDAELRLESEPGLGSTFILVLKPAVPQTEPVATPDSGITLPVFNEGSTADTTENERYRLIVCDDNLDMQHFLHDVLQDIYEVTCAGNGQEVLDLMKDRLPDLIISDVMMPVMDGLELCRRIKQELRTSHIPVVLLTAKSETADQVEGLENGADLYIPKPFSMNIIRAQIQSLLQNRDRIKAAFRTDPLSMPELTPHSALDQELLKRVSDIIERRMTDETFTVDELAAEVGLSRTGLFTKLKAVAGTTPNDFIRLLRLKKAASLLTQQDATVSEACYQVGFSSTSYFSKAFQNQFGMSPAEFKHRKKGNA
ncbi:MAG: two-component regulator propeller domain-containing protein [Bacteroides sp.]